MSSIPRIGNFFLSQTSRPNLSRTIFLLNGYLGILQGAKEVGAQNSLGMSGVIHAPSYAFMTSRVTVIPIFTVAKKNLQYLDVAGNSIVTNSMRRSSFLNNNRFSDGQEISRTVRNPHILLPHWQNKPIIPISSQVNRVHILPFYISSPF